MTEGGNGAGVLEVGVHAATVGVAVVAVAVDDNHAHGLTVTAAVEVAVSLTELQRCLPHHQKKRMLSHQVQKKLAMQMLWC